MEIFALAVKMGLDFPTSRGPQLPQQIYQLPLTGNNGFNLDTISRDLLKRIRSTEEDSLVSKSKVDPKDQLRLDILKFIISDKQAEMEARKQSNANQARKAELKELIAKKQRENEETRSLEELQAELRSLS